MKHFVLWKLLALASLLLLTRPALAQREFSTWYFGYKLGLSFTGSTVRALTDGAMTSGEGCASISDSQGQLLFYTNGLDAWNRQHQPLASSRGLGGFNEATPTETPPNSATQGVTIVPKPGSTTEYYIFTVDAAENNLSGGLHYAVVDMSRQGGLGEVTRKAVPVPVPVGDGRLSEKLVAVRHANQQDIWIVVHGWNNNVFLSYLLTSAGLSTTPVISAGGSIHQGGGNTRRDYNALGYMKVSSNGQRLAVARYSTGPVELFDFNYGTGVVSGPRRLPDAPATYFSYYGLEFSPDGKLLYVGSSTGIYQYNIQDNTLLKVGQSIYGAPWALQLGPDQKIYWVIYARYAVGVIASPNTPGLGCGVQDDAVPGLSSFGHYAMGGLPNVLVRPPVPGELLANFGLLRSEGCLGESFSFAASLYPLVPDAVVTWTFGEPAAGAANVASGQAVQHRYASIGTYAVTMTVREVSGAVHIYTQSVTVLAPNTARLAVERRQFCIGEVATLAVTPAQPVGTTYRWQDGSTAAQFMARTAGRYWVDISSPQQCTVRDSVTLAFSPYPTVALGPDQLICSDQRLVLTPGPQLPSSTYRWQDGSTAPAFTATRPGIYSVVVTSALGCATEGKVQVRFGNDCPLTIPNIITPNGDQHNETFVLKGLEPGTCDLQIYNRWGKQVYQQAQYLDDWAATDQPNGLYYYLLVQPSTGRRFKGWVEVVR